MKKLLFILSLTILTACGGSDSEPTIEDPCNGQGNCWEMMSREIFETETCGLVNGEVVYCYSYIYLVKNVCTEQEKYATTNRIYSFNPPVIGDIYCDEIYEGDFLD